MAKIYINKIKHFEKYNRKTKCHVTHPLYELNVLTFEQLK